LDFAALARWARDFDQPLDTCPGQAESRRVMCGTLDQVVLGETQNAPTWLLKTRLVASTAKGDVQVGICLKKTAVPRHSTV
jgi:hypothetical protein